MLSSRIITPSLETSRLHLEPIKREHADELYALISDERLYRFIPQDPPASPDALRERYEFLEPGVSPGGDELWPKWILRSKSAGHCLGRVEATVQADGVALLAYEIIPTEWQKGLATEACKCVISALLDLYCVHTIKAEVDTRNHPSIRLLERLDFKRADVRYGVDFFKGASSEEFLFVLVR
jgi:[ribosomal protein S5]-alanine N-acetyltransferase